MSNQSKRSAMKSDGKKSSSLRNQSRTGSNKGSRRSIDSDRLVEKQKNQNVKQFLHRMKEKVGMVEKTDFPKALQKSFDKFDDYKLLLDNLAESICNFVQLNPKMRKVGDPEMKLEAPPGQDEYEMVGRWMRDHKDDFEVYKKYPDQTDLFFKLNTVHREYQFKSRRSIHNIRTFLKNDYWVAANHRQELEQLRELMDFARSEMKSATNPELIPLKAKGFEQSQTTYEEKIKQVSKLMSDLPRHKDQHVADLLEWSSVVRQYHEKVDKLIKMYNFNAK